MPTRPPRIVTLRLVVVSLVVGVVLAVLGVPIAAVVVRHTLPSTLVFERAERWEANGHMVYAMRYDYPLGWAGLVWATWWESGSEPVSAAPVLRMKFEHEAMERVTRGAPPADVRTPLDGQMRTASSYRVGFPFHAARSVDRHTIDSAVSSGAWRPTVRGRTYTVPYLPRWPGLLGNVVFYTLLVLAPVVALRWTRLRRRARRNLCLACGYDLSGCDGVCPECGLAGRKASGIRD